MVTETSSGAFLSLGDFLTAEEPVWVWDVSARRILWANRAGQSFWGASSLDALRIKRFSSKNKSVARLTSLAKQPEVKETVETLTLLTASGRTSLKCHIQGLLVAGGHPGFIVKALDYSNGRTPRPASIPAKADKSSERIKQTKKGNAAGQSDRTALDAISARLKTDKAPINRNREMDEPSANIPAAERIDPDTLAIQIRELSHEIRNPLAVILGFAERIKDAASSGKSNELAAGYASDIMESTRLALAILEDFTARAGTAEDRTAKAEPADMRSAIDSCIRLISPLANGSGIKVRKRADKEFPSLRLTDRILKQILLNLLMNAVRHQKTGGLIKVSAKCRKDRTVRLTVADDGRGMTKKEIRNAIAGSRAKRSRQPGNAGLGLPLVKRLVESAGGELSIESGRGKGTRVQIVFPAAA